MQRQCHNVHVPSRYVEIWWNGITIVTSFAISSSFTYHWVFPASKRKKMARRKEFYILGAECNHCINKYIPIWSISTNFIICMGLNHGVNVGVWSSKETTLKKGFFVGKSAFHSKHNRVIYSPSYLYLPQSCQFAYTTWCSVQLFSTRVQCYFFDKSDWSRNSSKHGTRHYS